MENLWRKRVMRPVLAHNPIRKTVHPKGAPFAYCVCGEAVVMLAGVWWHLVRAGSLHDNLKREEEAGALAFRSVLT